MQPYPRLLGSRSHRNRQVHQQTGVLLFASRLGNICRYLDCLDPISVAQVTDAAQEAKDWRWCSLDYGCIVSFPYILTCQHYD